LKTNTKQLKMFNKLGLTNRDVQEINAKQLKQFDMALLLFFV